MKLIETKAIEAVIDPIGIFAAPNDLTAEAGMSFNEIFITTKPQIVDQFQTNEIPLIENSEHGGNNRNVPHQSTTGVSEDGILSRNTRHEGIPQSFQFSDNNAEYLKANPGNQSNKVEKIDKQSTLHRVQQTTSSPNPQPGVIVESENKQKSVAFKEQLIQPETIEKRDPPVTDKIVRNPNDHVFKRPDVDKSGSPPKNQKIGGSSVPEVKPTATDNKSDKPRMILKNGRDWTSDPLKAPENNSEEIINKPNQRFGSESKNLIDFNIIRAGEIKKDEVKNNLTDKSVSGQHSSSPGQKTEANVHNKARYLNTHSAGQTDRTYTNIGEKEWVSGGSSPRDTEPGEIRRNVERKPSVVGPGSMPATNENNSSKPVNVFINPKQVLPVFSLGGRINLLNQVSFSTANAFGISRAVIIREITQIIYQSATSLDKQTNILIDGGRLGSMEIQFLSETSEDRVTILVESESVRSHIQKYTAIINENLSQKGINLTSIDVQVGNFEQHETWKKESNQISGKIFPSPTEVEAEEKNDSVVAMRDYGYNTIEVLA